MNNLYRIALVTSCMAMSLLISVPVSAQESEWECINSNSKSDYLVKQFQAAMKTSPVSQAIFSSFPKSPQQKTEADTQLAKPCNGCMGAGLKFKTDDLVSFKIFMQTKARINLSCTLAARQFSAKTAEVMCPENIIKSSPATFIGAGKNRKPAEARGSCMTLPMLDYQNLVYENMYRCIRKYSSAPFTPATIFEIVSQESTFKPNFTSSAGHGAGQLTDIFAEDVQRIGRGYSTLESIAKDSTEECKAAQIIAAQDIKRKVSLPKNRCEFIQYGSGMERNALWMMVGLDTLWRKNLNPRFAHYLEAHKDHHDLSKVMEKLLQMAYGRAGQKGMYALFNMLKDFKPDEFLAKLNPSESELEANPPYKNLIGYLTEIADRQKGIGDRLQPQNNVPSDQQLKTKFAKEGASACIE